MEFDAIVTLLVVVSAFILFATEVISIDLVAILVMVTLVLFGVISPQEGVEGFSNKATVTVAFMFVLSATVLKTGSLQFLAYKLSKTFRNNFQLGMILMMLLIAIMSAFINNTPIVAIFIPVIIQIAHASGQSPSKMLIPLSFASIFGGTCTLIGTSTNILVSGIAVKSGLPEIKMFDITLIGLVFLVIGTLYMVFIGNKLLPDRKNEKDLSKKFDIRNYITQIELLEKANSVGKKISESPLVNELEMDVIQVIRNGEKFELPDGDFVLDVGDVLKVKCDLEKITSLKNRVKAGALPTIKIGENDLTSDNSTLVEMVITSDVEFAGKTIEELDFRQRFRAVPLAIMHRDEVIHDNLNAVQLKTGDVVLVEVKSDFVQDLKKLETDKRMPFVLLSQNIIQDFNKKQTLLVSSVIATVILLATFNILDIMIGTISGVALLVLLKTINMKEVYEAISWKVVFLLVGSLSLGTAMHNSGLDKILAGGLIKYLGDWGPIALLSGLYLATSIVTEIMSNNAAAALLTPIAIATASSLGVSPTPFIVAILFAASASFATPIGYHCNTMVYEAGNYKFMDFFKVGAVLNILFWIVATIFIPLFFPFK